MADASLGFHVIDIDVRIRGEGIVAAGEFAAGIDELVAGGIEIELFEAAERFGGQFKRGSFQDIHSFAQFLAVEGRVIGMRNVFHEMVPVAVHQAFDGAGRGLGKVGINVCRLLDHLEFGDIHHVLSVRMDLEFGHAARYVTHLFLAASIGIHHVELTPFEEGDALAAFDPAGVGEALRGMGQLMVVAAVDIHHEEVAVAAVLFDGCVGHAIENLGAVGRDLKVGDLAELVHDLGREVAVRDRYVVFFKHRLRRLSAAASTDQGHKGY